MIAKSNLYEAHREWATRPADQRYQTLSHLRDAVNDRRMRSKATNIQMRDVTVAVAGDDLRVDIGTGLNTTPTNWSFGQFASLVEAPAAFVRRLSAPVAASVLNECASVAPRDSVRALRVLSPDGGSAILQAMTSTSYGRIWDADVVAAVQKIVDWTGGKFHNPKAYPRFGGGEPVPSGLYASDRDVFMFLVDGGSVFDVGPRAKMSRGFFAWNSEVGSRAFGLKAFMFNHVCGNHIVWGATEVAQLRIVHAGNAPARFVSEAVPALRDYTSADPNLDAVAQAQKLALKALPLPGYNSASDSDAVLKKALGSKFDLTGSEIEEAVRCAAAEERREFGELTVWDFVQGMTASARDYEFVDARVDLEARAGRMLDALKQ